ncbi:MAG: hypothetical protein M3N43_05365 [Actinomycetota bacterium]|nr:hypothetical protein [Actinomycetota bacterium]
MTTSLRLYRLWRTSGVLCLVGAAEFGYLAWVRQAWWPVVALVLCAVVAGFAFRKAAASRGRPS